ncbi:tyrosine-type recombinase/integrase [Curtobacterium flaccumfaciens pv. flaccumfaciens]|uniref:tyrosine-type recombinase/integrase n=1 Tax=Curtobacterium flaccumfaciens TaxID=2035 RepID=UPI001BDED7B1|nr:tyrosine-type recombinase/integrase [Curtobacterium flaccumfaciens]MBT1669640.1 tyrosine-type recombinase/integrase [Curtobacterium flaccumfaciens pv. flaccumfaciens]
MIEVGLDPLPRAEHSSGDEWRQYVEERMGPASAKNAIRAQERFVRAYPLLSDWLHAPLEERLGRLRGESRTPSEQTNSVSYQARPYLLFLSVTGRLPLPMDFLLMSEIRVTEILAGTGCDDWNEQVESIAKRATLGEWNERSAKAAIYYTLSRICLNRSDFSVPVKVTSDDFEQFRANARSIYQQVNPLCNLKWKGKEDRLGKAALSAAFETHAIFYQYGLVEDPPVRTRPSVETLAEDTPTPMARAFDAWLSFDASRGSARKSVRNKKTEVRYFLDFLAENASEVTSLDQLHRAHITHYLTWLAARKSETSPGDLLGGGTRRSALITLATALREMWELDIAPAPGHAIVHSADYPKPPKSLPRFLPPDEVRSIEVAIDELEDLWQRAALLIARASGARRDEIRRLSIDCLGHYDNGAPSLLLPAGKTGKERIVPIRENAAQAIEAILELRKNDRDRGRFDTRADRRVRHLFVKNGRLLSATYLFDDPLQKVCEATGLLTTEGGRLVTAHRFRHTLGTELAEAGARFQSIMAILGHESPEMVLVYAKLSDKSIREDYEKALKAGTLAGPAAERILANSLTDAERSLLDREYYRTELGLGRCLKLPQEGPCECELYFNCEKFFTTPSHAGRLRGKYESEIALAQNASKNGWARGAENYRAKASRVLELLGELGLGLDGDVEPVVPTED